MKQLYKDAKLSQAQVELGLAIFGQERFDEIVKEGRDMTKMLEQSNVKFKAFRQKATTDIMELLNSMPPEVLSPELIEQIQQWCDSQREAMTEQSKAKVEQQIKAKGHEGMFFRPLSQSTNVTQKKLDNHSIWFGGK